MGNTVKILQIYEMTLSKIDDGGRVLFFKYTLVILNDLTKMNFYVNSISFFT